MSGNCDIFVGVCRQILQTILLGENENKSRNAAALNAFLLYPFVLILYDSRTCPQYSHLSMPSSSVPPQLGHWIVSTLMG